MHEHLDVPYHQQDTDYYCGAACAQMVLRAAGLPLPAQDGLYNDNHGHSVEAGAWATPPDGLCWTLNHRLPAKHFTLDSTDAEDPISRTICWAIHRYQCAPIALVYGGNHWLVVRGYSASAVPAAVHDTSYAIEGFDINNPWPPVPAPPGPPPHGDGDACGSGGVRGFGDVNVTYRAWQLSYLTANTFGARWLGRYVAVCDPDPTDQPAPPAPPAPAPRAWRPRFDGRRLLLADEVRADLRANLADAGLGSHPVWSRVFDDVRTAEPLLVERLDHADAPYWIVPTVDAQARTRAIVGVDARHGNYEQALAVRDPASAPLAFADPGRARERVLRGVDLPRGAGRLALRPQDLDVQPALVWKPCRESLSPFDPFRLIRAGAHTLYVRAHDGAVFTELTRGQGGL